MTCGDIGDKFQLLRQTKSADKFLQREIIAMKVWDEGSYALHGSEHHKNQTTTPSSSSLAREARSSMVPRRSPRPVHIGLLKRYLVP